MDIYFSKKEKNVGVFIIGIIMLLLITIIIIGRGKDWFKTYIIYYTTFNESYNLQDNASVKLFKTNIGKVKEIALDGNKVKVKLAILEEYSSRIRTDSIAIVESPTFIGSEYVSIQPGSHDATLIPEGGEIKSEAKKKISDFMAEFQVEKTAKMVVQAAQDISEITKIMRDPNGPFFTAVDNTNKTISHLEAITSDIRAGKGIVGSLLKSRTLLETIQNDLDKAGTILENIGDATTKTPETMDTVQDNLVRIKNVGDGVLDCISSIKKILKEVEKGSSDIPKITESTKRGVNEIRDGVENINKVVQSLQKNILIRSNMPPEPKGENVDAGLRQ